MTAPAPKSSRFNSASRCTHLFPAGNRCRAIAPGDAQLCATHAKSAAARRESDELAATLTGGLDQFTSALPIHQFLSRLLLLLAQDRISPRRGAVMAYTANLLLRSASVIEQQAAATGRQKRAMNIIWDLPCPPREREYAPEPPHTTTLTK